MNPIVRNLLLGAGALVAAVLIFRRSDERKAEDAALGFTEIPGPVDELGAAANRLSGGTLARFGSFLGEFVTRFTDTRTVDDLTGGPVAGTRPTQTAQVPADFVGPPI